MLVPPQLAALVPGQQANDVVLNAGAGQGRGREVAQIADAQSIDACKLRNSPESLSEIPGMRSLALETWVGFRRESILVVAVAWRGGRLRPCLAVESAWVRRSSSVGRI